MGGGGGGEGINILGYKFKGRFWTSQKFTFPTIVFVIF